VPVKFATSEQFFAYRPRKIG